MGLSVSFQLAQDAPQRIESSLLGRLNTVPVSRLLRDEIRAALETHDLVHAEHLLVNEIDHVKPSPGLLSFAGALFFMDGQYLNSAIALKRAEKAGRLDYPDRFLLCMAYVALKHRDWARLELEKLAALEPANANYTYWLGRLDYDDRNYPQAAAKFKEAIRLDSTSVKAYDNLALSYEAMGLTEEAIASYEKAVELNRTARWPSAWPCLNLGAFLLKAGQIEKAEPYLTEASAIEPKNPECQYRLGLLFEKQGNPQEALEHLRLSTQLKPGYSSPYYAMARIYRRLGKNQDANDALDKFQQCAQVERSETR